jgi:hypothetical protein
MCRLKTAWNEITMRIVRFDPRNGYPVGPQLCYRCKSCKDIVPSEPSGGMGCKCHNIFIDVDYARISVKRDSDIELLESDVSWRIRILSRSPMVTFAKPSSTADTKLPGNCVLRQRWRSCSQRQYHIWDNTNQQTWWPGVDSGFHNHQPI